jgi:hypothetical protein
MDLRDHAPALEDVAAVRTARGNLVHDDGTPEEVAFATVTPNMFRMLGVRVILGRDFIESDSQPQPMGARSTAAARPALTHLRYRQPGVLPALWRKSCELGAARGEGNAQE